MCVWGGGNIRMYLNEAALYVGPDQFNIEQGPVAGTCDHFHELSGSMKFGKLLDQLTTYQLLNKDLGQYSCLLSQSVALDGANVVLKSEVRMTAVYIPVTDIS